ncbi:MAG: uroporphyrinogen decarboxylase family protein [Thermoguttaceae bacterium]
MTSRELVVRTLNQEPVPRVPRDLWIPDGEGHPGAEDLAEINLRYPSDIVVPDSMGHAKRSNAKNGKPAEYTDVWGCVWGVAGPGMPDELKQSPLNDAAKMAAFKPPAAPLDHNRFSRANKTCSSTSRFVLAWSEVRPLDRLRMLCGEHVLVQLARGTRAVRSLLATLHEANCKELERWAATEVDGVALRDDWGTPDGLLVSPEMWRDQFRPLYRDYCSILHAKDKFVFFRSEGNIADIFGDLVKLGIDAVHCDLGLMNPQRVAKRFRGKVTFWGGMDRQRLREPGTPDEFREAVLSIRRAFDFGAGGVIAQCQWDSGVRLQTIASFFDHWLVPLALRA